MSYIVPKDIPKTCGECDFARESTKYDDKVICTLSRSAGITYMVSHQKYAFCPLREVKELQTLFHRENVKKYLQENPPKYVAAEREVTE